MMTFDYCVLTQNSHVSTLTYMYTANGALAITQSDNSTPTSDPSSKLTLPCAFCIPKLTMQLLSAGKIIHCNCYILFSPSSCIV